ncbi:MAG: tRNA guanosine(34) transglycosylase Tgt [Anaerolineaceae bacterium]|nr:tRNA guanosine(34) transglycosylase Tgt [Anaerolineaceae bacterium]
MKTLHANGQVLKLPVFFPDATYGFVRSLTGEDLQSIGLQGVEMNSFHLMQKPGSTVISALGGLHRMANWPGLIMTDSGGFQAYSLIRQDPKFGKINKDGILFFPEGSNRKLQITPGKSIQLQLAYGSDLLVCLDDCTHVEASRTEQEASVQRTIAWAKESRQTYDLLIRKRKKESASRPLLFAVIQGGGEFDLRKRCAEALLEIGFDGFGFGGWPLDSQSRLLTDVLEYTRSLIPRQFPIHALGIGHPVSIAACFEMGYEMFDCAMPTRDARHGRLYARTTPGLMPSSQPHWFNFKYVNSESSVRAAGPVWEDCNCTLCKNYSLGYLYHLYKLQDPSYFRLATLHNLRFMTQLMEDLRSHAPN